MKKIKSLKLEPSKLQLSVKDLKSIKGGNDPGSNKPDFSNGDPPPEIGSKMFCFSEDKC